jgi:hypothetical protein
MTDAMSIVPTQVLSGGLSDPTAMLFGLEEEFSGQSRVFRTFDFVVFQAAFWLVR